MENTFYGPADYERSPGSLPKSEEDNRDPFQIDRDRIIFSFAFRRLQSKTQVFQSGEYDFYRTRLTHSIEVAKLGRSICDFLRRTPENCLQDRFRISPSLTEAICLAHDLGHPPFGHIGERKLNDLMAPYGGFEGNAQTVRILTELIYKRPDGPVGMSPSIALIDGVMKYKMLWSEHPPSPEKPYPAHHFIYDSQANLRQTVFGQESAPPLPTDPQELNSWKSIECQVMDWADDTAYSLNDIADGIQAGYITLESLESWISRQDQLSDEDQASLSGLEKSIRRRDYERRLSYKLGQFIQAVRLVPVEDPVIGNTHRHAFRLEVSPEIQAESRLYKRIAVDLIFQSPQIQQVEFKGSFILDRLFQALMDHYISPAARSLGILPRMEAHLIREEPSEEGKARRVCDYLAGLTDGEAIRIYRRLFDPEFGSITDLA